MGGGATFKDSRAVWPLEHFPRASLPKTYAGFLSAMAGKHWKQAWCVWKPGWQAAGRGAALSARGSDAPVQARAAL